MDRQVVITGANRGIGLELARQFGAQGDHVIALCRMASPEIKEVAKQVIEDIDITQSKSLKRAKESIQGTQIDILINNAGLLVPDQLGQIEMTNIRRQMDVNAYGPLELTMELLDLLKSPSKLIFITSRMGSIADNSSGGYYGYRASKAALNCFGKSLAMDLKSRDIAVALLHPGFVRTEMTNFNGELEPNQAAAGLVQQIETLDIQRTGSFWHSQGQELPW